MGIGVVQKAWLHNLRTWKPLEPQKKNAIDNCDIRRSKLLPLDNKVVWEFACVYRLRFLRPV